MVQTSLIEKLSKQWDLRIGPYRGFFPTSKEVLQECKQMISGEEHVSSFDQEKGVPKYFAACEDTRTNKVVACLYMDDMLELSEDLQWKEAFNLSLFPEESLSGIAALSPIYFKANEQKSLIAQVLVSHCFIEILKAGGLALVISCDIGFFSVYKRFGLRPIGALRNEVENQHAIPMIFLPDKEYLTLIHSPVLDLLRGSNFADYQFICQWYYQVVREHSELQIGAAFHPEYGEDIEKHHSLTEGLSAEGLKLFLGSAMVVKCRDGEVLITENDGGEALGYIQKGIVQVVIGGKTIVMLSEGDIFGEIALILNTKRSAQVVAAGRDTEIVLFSSQTIHSLNETDKTIIWRNLARVVVDITVTLCQKNHF